MEVGTKICKKCKKEKSLSEFHNDKRTHDLKRTICKECIIEYNKSHPTTKEKRREIDKRSIAKNPEKRKAIWHRYYLANKDKIAAQRKIYLENGGKEKNKIRRQKIYKERGNFLQRERRKLMTPKQKISKALRDRFYKVVVSARIGKKHFKTETLIGCSYIEFVEHIESQFLEGMNWNNHGYGENKWHIDHIIPISKFDLSNKEQQLKAFNFKNLRPLWQIDNLQRPKKFNYEIHRGVLYAK